MTATAPTSLLERFEDTLLEILQGIDIERG